LTGHEAHIPTYTHTTHTPNTRTGTSAGHHKHIYTATHLRSSTTRQWLFCEKGLEKLHIGHTVRVTRATWQAPQEHAPRCIPPA
jgi:hypothetical protein